MLLLQLVLAYVYLAPLIPAFRVDLHSYKNMLIKRTADVIPLQNRADVSYFADIDIGGSRFSLLVDTGRYVAHP